MGAQKSYFMEAKEETVDEREDRLWAMGHNPLEVDEDEE
jgi:hypothetical protein